MLSVTYTTTKPVKCVCAAYSLDAISVFWKLLFAKNMFLLVLGKLDGIGHTWKGLLKSLSLMIMAVAEKDIF